MVRRRTPEKLFAIGIVIPEALFSAHLLRFVFVGHTVNDHRRQDQEIDDRRDDA